MLQLQNISKQYKTGDLIQHALNGVSLNLRQNEFVSILGPSGSGKTTLLNIIGGLDRYDSGDLLMSGTSTRNYRDRNWDAYRSHTIGFVFQSYHLIPHQSILANVELALTIGGMKRSQRRQKARQALEAVGLGDQCHKRPNQLSGGQMQRVAIARALVNDPEVLLADEPTGALDTETSLQVMELLKEVAKDRLVVMVTHNPELAEAYSTRIVKLRDGRIVSDSNPYTPDGSEIHKPVKTGKAKMGFLTSLALSFHNLLTKKGRTLLTAFAGSIGIIGIALILALSTGVNTYIANIQKETMTSYPITLQAQTLDTSRMLALRDQFVVQQLGPTDRPPRTGIYADTSDLETANAFAISTVENDLTAFRKYLENPDSEIRNHLGENGVVYTYHVRFSVYTYDSNGELVDTNSSPGSTYGSGFGGMSSFGQSSGNGNFSELMPGINGQSVSPVITDSYDLLYGHWPENANEVVLVLDENNAISLDAMYQLGLITWEEHKAVTDQFEENGEAEELHLDYAEVSGQRFYLIPECDFYTENEKGTFSRRSGELETLPETAIELTVCGVVRPLPDAANATISTAIGYTSALTDRIIAHTDASAVITAQEQTPQWNVLTGVNFEAAGDAQKIADITCYIQAMDASEKVSLYSRLQRYGATGEIVPGTAPLDDAAKADFVDQWLENAPDPNVLVSLYGDYLGSTSYGDNLDTFGKVSYDAPSSISIYTDSFEAKDAIAECIHLYNEGVEEDSRITYTDYVKMMTSSLTSIIDAISYVLIAFVAVSLVVSSIMIGIITHISVLERTKEIGILRAMGASKQNISQVFNAETVIIGLCAGLLGVGITIALTVPINALLSQILGPGSMAAQLPVDSAAVLVGISVIVTVIGGLMPAKKAAKMDPVTALRTE